MIKHTAHLAFVIATIVLSFANPIAYAQERTAGGSLSTEASWSALKSLIDVSNANINILKTDVNALKGDMVNVKTDVNAIKACGALGKIWTGTQCVNPGVVETMLHCGNQNMIYNQSTNSCVSSTRWTLQRVYPGATSSLNAGGATNTPNMTPCIGYRPWEASPHPSLHKEVNLDRCAPSQVGQTCYAATSATSCHDDDNGRCTNGSTTTIYSIYKCI